VTPAGGKTWIYEKRIKGGPKRKHTLGPYPQVSISSARTQAAELELEAIRGLDRVSEEHKAKLEAEEKRLSRTSVSEVLAVYDRLHLKNLRTAGERRRMLDNALAHFMKLPIEDLTRRDLQKIVDTKADEGKLVYANRYKAALSHFARFAWNRGYTEIHAGDGLTGAVREKPRDRVLSIEEIRKIWEVTRDEGGVFGPLVRLLILTAQRRADIGKLTWSEVNFGRRRIELVGERTKNEKAHITHLSDPALHELTMLRASSELDVAYVFTTNRRTPVSGFAKLKRRLDARLGPDFQPWRLHDLRTAFATAMAEAGEPEALVDRILNHVASGSAPSAVARVYNQSSQLPQRARILDKWADLVTNEGHRVVNLSSFA